MSIAFLAKEAHVAVLSIFVFEGFIGITDSVSVEGFGPSFLEFSRQFVMRKSF
jgi:hypothetical protein